MVSSPPIVPRECHLMRTSLIYFGRNVHDSGKAYSFAMNGKAKGVPFGIFHNVLIIIIICKL
jgi:hypothetical protein